MNKTENITTKDWDQTKKSIINSQSLFIFVLAFLLVLLGQYILLNPNVDIPNYPLAEWLETSLQLGIPNLNSYLIGAGLLIAGGILIVHWTRKEKLVLPEFNPGGKMELPISKKILSSWQFIASLALNIFLIVQFLRHDNSNYLAIIWILSLIPMMILAWQLDSHAKTQLSPNLQRKDIVIVLLVLFAGFLFGAYRLEGVPNFLMGDEGTFWTTARDIARGSYAPLAFDFGVYTYPILSSIYQAAVMKLTGINMWGWRFSSVLAALFTIPALYLLTREIFNRKIATISIIALIFSPYFLAFSRFGYNNSQTLLPVTLAITCGYLGFKRSSFFYLILAGYAAGMGFYTYTAAQSGILILGLLTFILLLQKKGQRKQVVLAGITILMGWYLAAGPQRIFGMLISQESYQVKLEESIFFNADYATSFLPEDQIPGETGFYFGENQEFFYDTTTWLVMNIRGVIRTLLAFHTPILVSEHMIASPLAGTAGSLFYLLGFFYSLAQFKERRNITLLIWHGITITTLSALNTFPPRHTHMVGIIPLIAIWIGVGIYLTEQLAARIWRQLSLPFGQFFTSGILVIIIAVFGLHDYFFKAPETYWPQEENIINWAGLYNQDVNFLYVTTPGNEEFTPFIMREILPEIAYTAISQNDLKTKLQENLNTKTVVYFPIDLLPEQGSMIAIWPKAIENIYTNREGNPILYAVTNDSEFIFSVPHGFNEINDAFKAPLILLLSVLAILILLFIFMPYTWLKKMPQPVWRFANWLTESQHTLPGYETITLPQGSEKKLQLGANAEKATTSETTKSDHLPSQPQYLEQKEIQPQFIEIELKIRIHTGGKEQEWAFSELLKKFISNQKSKLISDITISNWNPPHLSDTNLVGIGFALAILAQFLLNIKMVLPGVVLYLITASAFFFWLQKNPSNSQAVATIGKIHYKKEWILLFIILVIGILARTYQIGNIPYGIEGDESKWNLQAFYSTILNIKKGDFGHHFENQPVSFYLIGTAMRLIEIDMLVPRYLNSLLSCLSLILFYFALRRATEQSTALIGTFLYAISFSALSAGRQALHDTYIEVWINLAFLALVNGLESRKSWQMLLAGIALSLGSLTYETFYPILATFLLYAVIYLIRQRQKISQTIPQMAALLFPVIMIAPQVYSYAFMREEHHMQAFYALTGEINPNNQILANAIAIFQYLGQALQTLFISIVYPDSLTRWPGPIVNPWILPFFLIGLIIALNQIKNKHYLLLVIWFFIGFFGFSALGAGYPRVLFAALMAIYALAAIGVISVLNIIRSLPLFSSQPNQKRLLSGFAFLLIFLAGYDFQIYAQLPDWQDRQERRELYDTFTSSLNSSTHTILAYSPYNESVFTLEAETLDMLSAGVFDMEIPENAYKILSIENILSYLWSIRQQTDSVNLLIDQLNMPRDNYYAKGVQTILSCYPDHTKIIGKYTTRYILTDLEEPECFSLTVPNLVSPSPLQNLPANQKITFNWEGSNENNNHEINIQARNEEIVRLEAETMKTDGWYPENKFVLDFSGTGYLTDNFNAGLAETSFDIKKAGNYTVWVRTYRRRINDQVNYLAIDSNPAVPIAQTPEESLNTWVWENVGSYPLEEGSHKIIASRTYGKDEQYSVFIDAFIISAIADYHPEKNDEWTTIFSSAIPGQRKNSYLYSENLKPGQYRWWVSYTKTPGLVNWLGTSEISAEPIEFTVSSP